MVNPNSRIAELIGRHLNGTLSEPEGAELNEWVAASEEHRQIFERYNNERYVCEELEKHYHFDVKEGWEKLVERANIPFRVTRPVVKLRWILSVAAAVLLLVVFSWIFIVSKPSTTTKEDHKDIAYENDVQPGGTRAMLKLADGSVIVLDSAGSGALAQQGGAQVVKTGDGSLKYDVRNKNAEVLYNTLTTPRGGSYQIVLPDGSKVILNAESSIRYPTVFTGKDRRVEITGELFMEVAKNKALPFIVSTKGMQVQVTGTSFNVQAYSDETLIRTTLLEGGVKIITPTPSFSGSVKEVVLRPGEQAIVGKSVEVSNKVDLEEVLAWKNNMFIFNNTNIEVLMRQLQRWYNVETEYNGDVKNLTFSGQISRYSNISEVLEVLELSGVAHFKLQNKKILVTE